MGRVGGESAGEVETRQVQGSDVTSRVAGDARPGAVAGGGVPGGEG